MSLVLHANYVRRSREAVLTCRHCLTTLPTGSLVSQVFHILEASVGREQRAPQALLLLLKTALCGRREAALRATPPLVPAAITATVRGRRPLAEDAPCCSRHRMPIPPARAPHGDPDMTRRLPDRANVRRQGQTRCCCGGQTLTTKQPSDLVQPSLEQIVYPCRCPLPALSVSEPNRGCPCTSTAWSSISRSSTPHIAFPSPSPPENTDQCSSSSSPSDSSVPIATSATSGPLTCSAKLSQSLPQHKSEDEHCANFQLDNPHPPVHSVLGTHQTFETGRTTVFQTKRWQKFYPEAQASVNRLLLHPTLLTSGLP